MTDDDNPIPRTHGGMAKPYQAKDDEQTFLGSLAADLDRMRRPKNFTNQALEAVIDRVNRRLGR